MLTVFFYSFGCVFFTTLGQILLKIGASNGAFLKNKFSYMGYSSFLIVLGFSYLLMRIIEFKYFVIIMSTNYVSVTLVSTWFFNERFTLNKVIGSFLVTAGVAVFVMGN